MGKTLRRVILWAALFMCPSVVSGQAAKLPALAVVPDQLSDDVRIELNRQRTAIEAVFAKFKADGDAFSQKDANTQTDEEYEALQARRKKYIEDATKFNESVAVAVKDYLEASPQLKPALEDVHRALPSAIRDSLDERHAGLASTRDSLRIRIKDFEERCIIYFTNTPEVRTCPGSKVKLYAETEAYIVAVKHFNWNLEQAIGEERYGLEKRIREAEQAIGMDARAVKRFGFDRRAEDFDKWARLSRESQTKAIDKLLERVFETGVDEMRDGIFKQLTGADRNDIDGMLLKLQVAGLGASASADVLRQYQATNDKQLLKPLAKQLSEDLRSVIKFDDNYQKGENFEAAWEALQFFSPPGMRQVLAVAETAAWATYGAAMQVVAVAEVARLNTLTDKELKGIQTIHCLFEKHALDRYDARLKLAMLTYGDASGLAKPTQSRSCATRRT